MSLRARSLKALKVIVKADEAGFADFDRPNLRVIHLPKSESTLYSIRLEEKNRSVYLIIDSVSLPSPCNSGSEDVETPTPTEETSSEGAVEANCSHT